MLKSLYYLFIVTGAMIQYAGVVLDRIIVSFLFKFFSSNQLDINIYTTPHHIDQSFKAHVPKLLMLSSIYAHVLLALKTKD